MIMMPLFQLTSLLSVRTPLWFQVFLHNYDAFIPAYVSAFYSCIIMMPSLQLTSLLSEHTPLWFNVFLHNSDAFVPADVSALGHWWSAGLLDWAVHHWLCGVSGAAG